MFSPIFLLLFSLIIISLFSLVLHFTYAYHNIEREKNISFAFLSLSILGIQISELLYYFNTDPTLLPYFYYGSAVLLGIILIGLTLVTRAFIEDFMPKPLFYAGLAIGAFLTLYNLLNINFFFETLQFVEKHKFSDTPFALHYLEISVDNSLIIQDLILISFLFALYITAFLHYKERETREGDYILWGLSLLMISMFHDLFYMLHDIDDLYLVPFSYIIFIILDAYHILMNQVSNHHTLEHHAQKLEAEVQQRTRELHLRTLAEKELNLVLLQARAELHEANKKLKHQSEIDFLTNIPNHRYFKDSLEYFLNQCKSKREALSILMIDIDFFKQYNDTYGHQKGDETLKQVALTLQATAQRKNDFVARYGGEEFSAILPYTPYKEAGIIAQKMCTAIEAQRIEHKASQVSKYVSISVGLISITPDHSMTPDELIHKADLALYEAKKSGRNRFCFYTE